MNFSGETVTAVKLQVNKNGFLIASLSSVVA